MPGAPREARRPIIVSAMRTLVVVGLVAGAAALGSLGCDEKKTPPPPSAPAADTSAAVLKSSSGIPKFDPDQTRVYAPIPAGVEKPELDDATKLGQMLFWDTRISPSGKYACVTCHDFSKVGADGAALPTTPEKQSAPRNTPTVFNCGGSYAQGWDGRSSTVEDFALLHTLDPSVMGIIDEKQLVANVSKVPAYVAAFKKAFPDEKTITGELYGRAVGTFTKKLFARARWDKYLGGDTTALKEDELAGFAMFMEAGCQTCHQGKYVGASQPQKLGMAKPWPGDAGADPGRFLLTHQEMDRGIFKVPTLRNVTRTGPYLHDGSIANLAEVTKLMARHQVGRELSDEQANAIVKFLGALEGDPPQELTAKPVLPK